MSGDIELSVGRINIRVEEDTNTLELVYEL